MEGELLNTMVRYLQHIVLIKGCVITTLERYFRTERAICGSPRMEAEFQNLMETFL